MSILDRSFLARTRRHHALEHATIHILNRRFPTARLMGWSMHQGFFIYGPVSTADVRDAVVEGLTRLRRGESQLAIHPHCGTNLVISAMLVGLLVFVTMLPGDQHSRLTRLPLVLLVSTLAFITSQPLGLLVQQHVTTDARLGNQRIATMRTHLVGNIPLHQVQLAEQATS